MTDIDVSVVVVACHDGRAIVDCLESVTRVAQGRRCEIIVVGSPGADVVDVIRTLFPDIMLITPRQQLSAEAARNRGAAAARGGRILFVNLDGVASPGWINRLEDALADPAGSMSGSGGGLPAASHRNGITDRLRRCLGRASDRLIGLVWREQAADPRTVSRHAKAASECLATGDDDGAIVHFRQSIVEDASFPAWVSINLANLLMKQERFEEADRVFLDAVQRHPDNVQGHMGLGRVLLARQDWRRAADAYEAVVARFPDTVHAIVGVAEALRKLGRFDEAEALLQQATRRWPDAPPPLRGLARVTTARRDFQEASARWQETAARFPDDLSVRASYTLSLLDALDVTEARAVFEAVGEASRTPAYQSVLADIHAASYDWPAAVRVLRKVVDSAPMDVDLRLKEVTTLRNLSRFTGEPAHREQAISLCEALVREFPHSLQARVALAECYIVASRDADAARVIDALPAGLETHKEVMELKAWRRHHAGDLEGAKQVWQAIQRDHYLPVVHGPLGSLEQLDGRPPGPASGEVLLFTVLRNQNWRLPFFLDYYRRLGVNRFFVVDNGSDDGGTEFLLGQEDVHVFRTLGSYAKAESGMRWVNELVQRFGDDHWCLYVDADEMLVFPGVEDLGLRHLLGYMERKGHEAFFAFMLDMHGPSARYRPECRPGEDLLPLYPYFENSIRRAGAVYCPYRQVSGGIQRLFRSVWDLSKTPIIRGGRSIRFLSSSHAITPAALSDVTGVLLHFKMAGDPAQWSLAGIGDRMPLCMRRHLSYANDLQALEQDLDFMSESTVKYESSRELVTLGLSQCPADFLAVAPHHGGDDGK